MVDILCINAMFVVLCCSRDRIKNIGAVRNPEKLQPWMTG